MQRQLHAASTFTCAMLQVGRLAAYRPTGGWAMIGIGATLVRVCDVERRFSSVVVNHMLEQLAAETAALARFVHVKVEHARCGHVDRFAGRIEHVQRFAANFQDAHDQTAAKATQKKRNEQPNPGMNYLQGNAARRCDEAGRQQRIIYPDNPRPEQGMHVETELHSGCDGMFAKLL
uniref:Uncharacterized protein n=1 Tax=Anopheles farauti TaxID=69004 RepID=A0A182Q386_9DIPT